MTWDDYFLTIVDAVAKRSTCNRGRSACVIVSEDKCILTTGYVGSPHGLHHCDDVGHKMSIVDGKLHCIRTIHAEANAIAQAAKHGICLRNSTAYITMEPCLNCARLLVQSGIKKVICKYKYHDGQSSRDLFKKANVQLMVKYNKYNKYEE